MSTSIAPLPMEYTPVRQTTGPVLQMRGAVHPDAFKTRPVQAVPEMAATADKASVFVEAHGTASDENPCTEDVKDDIAERNEEKVDCTIFRKGHVVWFDNHKGYGFIKEDSTDDQYFVHYESIISPNPSWSQVKKGKRVAFKSLKDGEEVLFRLEPETQEEIRRKGKRGKKLKPFKAVDITGPNGGHVQGVRKVEASSRRQEPSLTHEERICLAKFREEQQRKEEQQREDGPEAQSDSSTPTGPVASMAYALMPKPLCTPELSPSPMPVQNWYHQYNQMPVLNASNSSPPMDTAYPMQMQSAYTMYPMPAHPAPARNPSAGLLMPPIPTLHDSSDATSNHSFNSAPESVSGAETEGRLAIPQAPTYVPAPVPTHQKWCYGPNGSYYYLPANAAANSAA